MLFDGQPLIASPYQGFLECNLCGNNGTGHAKYSVYYKDAHYAERYMKLHLEKCHAQWRTAGVVPY